MTPSVFYETCRLLRPLEDFWTGSATYFARLARERIFFCESGYPIYLALALGASAAASFHAVLGGWRIKG